MPDAAAARAFGRWAEARRRHWLRLHYARYRACTLRGMDFRAV
jgi:hypothetical protein